jgi:hypothetical protein
MFAVFVKIAGCKQFAGFPPLVLPVHVKDFVVILRE